MGCYFLVVEHFIVAPSIAGDDVEYYLGDILHFFVLQAGLRSLSFTRPQHESRRFDKDKLGNDQRPCLEGVFYRSSGHSFHAYLQGWTARVQYCGL